MASNKTGVDLQFSIEQKEALNSLREISSNISTMNKQLGLTNSELESNNASISTYQTKLETLKSKQEELSKKVELSNKMYEEAVSIYGSNSKEAQKWENTLLDNKTALQKVENQIDETSDEIKDFGKEEEKASEKTSFFGDMLKANLLSDAITNGLKSLVSSITSITSSFTDALASGAKYADNILTLSTQTGVSAESLQKYQAICELVDVSTETLTSSMAKNIKQMSSGNAAYKELGISVTDANGKLRDGETVYWECIDALGKVEDETQRDAIAMEIFGKKAQDLNPLIVQGSAGIKALGEEAERMGAVLNQQGLEALGSLDDEMQKFATITQSTGNIIASAFAPALSSLLGDINKIGGSFNNLIASILNGDEGTIEDATDEFIGYIEEFIENLGDKIPQMLEIGSTLITTLINSISDNLPKILETGVQVITTILKGITSNIDKILPVVVQVILSLATAIIENLPTILEAGVQVLLSLIQGIAQSLPDLIPVIIDAILTMVDTILDNIDLIIDAGIQMLLGLVDGIVEAIPKLIDKIPEIIDKLITAITTNLPKIIEAGITIIIKLAEGLIKAIPQLVSKIPDIIISLVKGLLNGVSQMSSVGSNLIKGLWEGIKNSFNWIKDKLKEWIGNIFDFIKKLFGIHSPSKLFEDEIGLNLGLGVAEGILDSIPDVQNAMDELASDTITAIDPNMNISTVTQENIMPSETRPIYLNIDTFNNNSDKDIESLAEELAFYIKQKEVTG